MPRRECCGSCSFRRAIAFGLVPAFLSLSAVSQDRGSESITSYIPTFTYDVVVIKKGSPADSRAVGINDLSHSGNLSADHEPVDVLIQDAYGVDSEHVSYGPSWIRSEPFNIQARSNSSVNKQLISLGNEEARIEKKHMLQTLLAERFNLKAHWVTKEVTAYSLVVSQAGSHLVELKHDFSDPTGTMGSTKAPPIQIFPSVEGYELVAHDLAMNSFASSLSHLMEVPVLNNTRLEGNYDFTLRFSPDGREQPSNAWPSIVTAVGEELGLKLEATKESVTTLVIDSIRHPALNRSRSRY